MDENLVLLLRRRLCATGRNSPSSREPFLAHSSAAAAAAAAAAALVLFAPSFATMAVWATVEAVERHVEALDAETRDVLQPVLHQLVRLRGLHESTLPQEQQLRRTHVALLSEMRLYAEKLRAIPVSYTHLRAHETV